MSVMELLNKHLKGEYITDIGLKNLKNYGYHGEDRSFFGNLVLKHWWNWVVQLFPMWFAPNLLTLLGFLCIVVSYGVVMIYSPHLTEPLPRWVFFLSSLLIFLYQTLDNIDGKQARRTGSSSPLGELFDHGCDSITIGLVGIITGAVVRGGGILTLIGLVAGWGPFFLAHWEEYHTGSLIMGEFTGPTEANLLVIVMFLFTGIVGSEFWVFPLFSIGGVEIRPNHIAFVFTMLFGFITIGNNTITVLNHKRSMPLIPTLLQLLPLIILILLSTVWGVTESQLLIDHPHILMLTISFIFAYLTSRFILHRVCQEPTQLFNFILIPLIMVVFASLVGIPLSAALPLAVILLLVSVIQFFFFSYSFINQITTHLGIRTFKIPYIKKERVE